MRNRAFAITFLLLIISIGSYSWIIADGTVRTVEFLSIWAIGALSGLLIFQVVKAVKESTK